MVALADSEGHHLAVNGMMQWGAFAIAIHPLIGNQVAKFRHVKNRCSAKVAGEELIGLGRGNRISLPHRSRDDAKMSHAFAFDELTVNIDEENIFSCRVTWEFKMCLSIFRA